MKLRPKVWSVTWRYLIFSLIVILVAIGITFNIYFYNDPKTGQIVFTGFGFAQILIPVLIFGVLISFYFVSIFSYYYVIEDKYFILKKMGKEFVFEYKNIEFIDIEESQKKNQVIFYSQKSKTRYLLGDKDGKLLETLIKKCPKTMTVEEFKAKHPEERY